MLKHRTPHRKIVYLTALALALVATCVFGGKTFAGNPFYPQSLVYYLNSSTGKQEGSAATANSFARAYSYRNTVDGTVGAGNVQTNFCTTDSPPPGVIIAADDAEGLPALAGWDVGSSCWSASAVVGDSVMIVLETRDGLNGWSGPSWVSGAQVTLTVPMVGNATAEFRDTVMEPIPTPTMQSNTTSSITIHWQGLWDNSTGAAGGSGPASVTGYSIYRSVDGAAYAPLANVAQSAGTNIAYTDNTTTPGHTYEYKLGVRFLWAAHAGGYYEPAAQSTASAPLTAGIPEPVMLKFLSIAPTLAAGTKSAVQTVQVSDVGGNAASVTSDTTVDLTTNTTGTNAKFYSVSAGVCTSTEVTSITVVNGSSTGQFCYYDEKAGSWTLTAATAGLTSAAQTATVTANSTLGDLVLDSTSPQKNRVAFTGTNTLTAKDAYDNTITGFTAATDNITFTVAPGTATPSGLGGVGAAQLTIAGDFVSGVANLTGKLRLSGTSGTYTLTATSASGKTTNATVSLTAGALDHFTVTLATPQAIATAFTGTNTIAARDIDNNTITDFDAGATSVTVTESAGNGTVSGLGSAGNTILNRTSDFTNGVASLTGDMQYAGLVGAHSFRATAGAVVGTSNSVTFTHGALSKFAVSLTTPQANDQPFATATITAQDVSSNTVTDFDASSNTVTLSSTGTGSLDTTSLSDGSSFVAGVADLSGALTFTGLVGSHTITATSASGKTGSQAVTITPGTVLTTLTLALAPAQKNRINFIGTNTLTAKDVSGNTMTGFNPATNNITFTVAPGTAVPLGLNGTGNAQLTQAADFTNGVASLTGKLQLGGTSDTYVVTATSASGKADTANVTLSGGALHHFDFELATPQAIDTAFTGTNNLTARDIDNNLITSFDAGAINVTVIESAGVGTVSGLGSAGNTILNRTSDFTSGVASLTGSAMKYTGPTGAHTFRATAGAVNTTSNSVTFNPGPFSKFGVNINTPQVNGTAFTTATITAQDVFGNTRPSFDASADNVTLSVTGTGALNTTSLTGAGSFVSGVVDLSGSLTFTGQTGSHTITATSASGKTGSAPVTITVGAPATAKIVNGSGSGATQITTSTLTADQTLPLFAAGYDVSNNWTGALSGTWGSTGTLAPVVTNTAVSTITFAPTMAPATGTITFDSGGLTAATGTVTVTPGALHHFEVNAPATATAGTPTSVGITAVDADGNTVTGYAGTQTIVFSQPGNGPTGGTPTYPASVTFANGTASNVPMTLVKAETVKLKATQGTTTGTSADIVVSGAAANIFTITAPGSPIAGVAFNVQITAYDQFGNIDTGYTGSHTLAFTNPGTAPDGTTPDYPGSVNFTAGAATASVSLFKREITSLRITEGAKTGVSSTISVGSGPVATIAQVSGDHQTGPVSQQLPLPVIVIIKDAYQNPKGASTVTFAVTNGAGSVTNAVVPTATDGTAQVSWTLGGTPGTDNNTVEATAVGAVGSPVIFTASASGNGFLITTPSAVNAGVPFTVQIKLIDSTGATITTYSGIKTLTFSGPTNGPNGDAPTYPATVTFVNGVAQPPSITLANVETTTLTATDGTYSGTSAPFVVNVGAPAKLTVVTTAQEVAANAVSGPITLCMQDIYGNAALATSDRTISMSGTSPGSQFSTSADGPWNGYQQTLPTGLDCLTLYYKDSYAGARTMTFTSGGLVQATQPIVVQATSEQPVSPVIPTTPTPGGGTTTPSTTTDTVTKNTHTTETIIVYVDRPTRESSVPADQPMAVIPIPIVSFPVIISPAAGSLIAPIDGNVIVEGTAPANQTLRILSDTGAQLGSATSDQFGQWRALVAFNKFQGAQQSIYAQLVSNAVRGASDQFVLKQPTLLERVIRFVTE